MTWFYYALLSAVINAFGILARKTHGSTARPLELAWLTELFMIPFTTALVVINHDTLYSSTAFILPTVAGSDIYAFAGVLVFTAYKYGDASEISPLQTLLPLGLIVSSFIMFGTVPTVGGLLGVLLVVFGVYYTSVNAKHKLLYPFKMIWHRRGSRAMLFVIVLWSVGTNLQQVSLETASPAFVIFFGQLVTFLLLTMYLAVQRKHNLKSVWRHWKWHILVIAGFTIMAIYFQAKAIQLLGNTSYVLSVKGLSILIVIPIAAKLLHEKHAMRRFAGAAIAVSGVAIIYILG